MNKIKVITHNGAFHADDVCGVAILDILYKGAIEVIRTRDAAVISTGDIVLDVGGKSDGEKFFDHHQEGGAGLRPNGLPYASFGLLWKRFGEEICGNKAVAEKFDMTFIQAIDAVDNGVVVAESLFKDVYPLSLNSLVSVFNPSWKEEDVDRLTYFLDAVSICKKIIQRTLASLQAGEEAKTLLMEDYTNALDKRVIVLQKHYPFQEVLCGLPEPLFAVYPSAESSTWHVKAVPENNQVFKNKKDFPSSWAGKMNGELAAITGVPDALFCHNKLFLATAKTKEGALALAKLALDQK